MIKNKHPLSKKLCDYKLNYHLCNMLYNDTPSNENKTKLQAAEKALIFLGEELGKKYTLEEMLNLKI